MAPLLVLLLLTLTLFPCCCRHAHAHAHHHHYHHLTLSHCCTDVTPDGVCAGHNRRGRLANECVAHTRFETLLRRHLLPWYACVCCQNVVHELWCLSLAVCFVAPSHTPLLPLHTCAHTYLVSVHRPRQGRLRQGPLVSPLRACLSQTSLPSFLPAHTVNNNNDYTNFCVVCNPNHPVISTHTHTCVCVHTGKDRYGMPSFSTVLRRIAQLWGTKREELQEQVCD